MARSQAARRYARALFQLSTEQNRSDAVCTDLLGLGELLETAPDLARFVGSYVIPSDQRVATLRALFEGKVDGLTFRFLLFLESKKRMGLLKDVVAEVGALNDERSGVVEVNVTSAGSLDPSQFAAITRRLEDRFGKRIKASAGVDAQLLGGFTVQVGGRILDYSVETQLQTLNRSLMKA
jgi:F-type H+-transporting ATPase subunit delta